MEDKHYDLIVFGGGNAISIAIECGAAGMNVALVERGPLGGTCPHRGCIPSKLLIGYADAAEHARDAQRFGFERVCVPIPTRSSATRPTSPANTTAF
jgi:dihydrolipoamide dehydrogenase